MFKIIRKSVSFVGKTVNKAFKGVRKAYKNTKKRIRKTNDAIEEFHKSLDKFGYKETQEGYETKGIDIAAILAAIFAIGYIVKKDIDSLVDEYRVSFYKFNVPFYNPVEYNIPKEVPDFVNQKYDLSSESYGAPIYTGSSVERWYVGMAPQSLKSSTDIGYHKFSYGYASGAAYHNILNVRPIRDRKKGVVYGSAYPGQAGYYHTRSGYFASFSDPYYGIAQAAKLIVKYQYDADKKARITKYGKGKYTLYAMASIFVWGSDTENYNYAKRIADYGKFPMGVDTVINIENDMEQFIAIIQAMALNETSTKLSREYLKKVWYAIFKGGTPPLRNILNSKDSVSIQFTSSTTLSGLGFNNVQK